MGPPSCFDCSWYDKQVIWCVMLSSHAWSDSVNWIMRASLRE